MALPLIALGGTVATIIRTIGGWFAKGGAVSSFFAWLGVKFTTKGLAVAWQIATLIALFASRVAFGIAFVDLCTTLYNYFNSFLSSLNSTLHTGDLLSTAYQVLISIGAIDALKDSFAVFNVCIVAIGVAYLLKYIFKTLEVTSNEYFKLSVLLQQ
ncbi:MAG: hypothetical protein PHW07_02310 [Sulfurospirillaceae bacterium]|nr:hypothetical protein [Sulfurospirillaceae bacterium]